MAADDDGLQDPAADYDGEGRERTVRDGRDSGAVMMAMATMVAAEDRGGGQQWQRWQITAADKDGMQDLAAAHDGEGQEQVANNDGIRHQTEKTMLFSEGVVHFFVVSTICFFFRGSYIFLWGFC